MEENVVSAIGGVGLYGVISISIFFAFFTGMLIWALCLKKAHIKSMVELPLDNPAPDQPEAPSSHPSLNL